MKILIVGNGGREHALAWKLQQDCPDATFMATPGNPGIAQIAQCVAVKADDVDGLVALAQRERPDVTVVGPEMPLAHGLVDRFRVEQLPVFGPTRAAAQIETSKRFAKTLMERAGVPTARASHHTTVDSAVRAAEELGAPVVIKASGLAAGKGVVIAQSLPDAKRAIESMLQDHAFGAAGTEILVEEFMTGEELSLFGITDGTNVVLLKGAQDHKRLCDGDTGPNTGGMGAYAPVSLDTPTLRETARTRIFEPTLAALRETGAPFTGLLYAGLMVTAEGPKVVEFNCRFGDPETQALLPLMNSSLLDPMLAVARGEPLAGMNEPVWHNGASVTTVLAAPGYPNRAETGAPITFPAPEAGIYVFHAGTKGDGAATVTAGGRVLAVTATAATLREAAQASQAYAERIGFPGKQMRHDIGWREMARA